MAFVCAWGFVVWSCSSDSRDFGDGQPGGAGDGGEPSSVGAGGTDVALNGGAGAGAETNGGTVSEAGGGSQSQELSVVSTSPEDAAAGSERDATIQVTFSAAIDAASITAESFQVTGPSGPVDGEFSVDGATVTFTPSSVWALLADYVVEVAATVAAVNAGELGAAYQFSFQSRDGVFSKPVRLSTASAVNFNTKGTQSGYVSAFWQTNEAKSTVEAAIYNPVTEKWGSASALETDAANAYSFLTVALNEKGEAFAAFDGPADELVWNRYNGVQWGVAKSEPTRKRAEPALADDGTAMTVWEDIVGEEYRVFAASLSPQNTWSVTKTLQAKARSWGGTRYGSGFLALVKRDAGGMYSHVFEPDAGWGTPLPITTGGVNYVSLSVLDEAALFTWNDPAGRVQAAVFDGTAWTATELGPVAGGTSSSVGPTRSLATWLYQKNAYGALYDANAGWGDPIKLGATTAEDYGPGAAVDAAGNAFAVWPNGSSIAWRRQPNASSEWLDLQEIKDQDPGVVYANVDAAGNVMLTWSNPLGVWASRFE